MVRIVLLVDENIPAHWRADISVERHLVIDIGDTTTGIGVVGRVESITIEPRKE